MTPPKPQEFEPDPSLPVSVVRQIDEQADRFESVWNPENPPLVETYLSGWHEPEKSWLLRELLSIEVSKRVQLGERPSSAEYAARFPHHSAVVDWVMSQHQALLDNSTLHAAVGTSQGQLSDNKDNGNDDLPRSLGRYRILRLLGSGGFGKVYLARDESLSRDVAIKVPHDQRALAETDVRMLLDEARIVASLDHPHIVPVYDVGQTDDGQFYVVAKYVAGTNLAQKLKVARPTVRDAAALASVVADALHYAHSRKLVHRDIKPENILLDTDDRPYVADFGLALKDADFGKLGPYAGTPAYMSPEQARGEGHLVDGRSDIFSLGVVFYEMIAGERPFTGSDWREVIERIATVEARPPRQLNDKIPRELERICLRALAKRAAERYTTALDMATDLRLFLQSSDYDERSSWSPVGKPGQIGTSDGRSARFVPKGLRAFDAEDAQFFLELMPGPRDRDGLPDSIRFWKTRIEDTDEAKAFRVGVIYGPSGCGKTSFVKAGLLPRLTDDVRVVYVEASPDNTESRLLRAVRHCRPDVPPDSSLTETLAGLRRGSAPPHPLKTLLVLDQFEQYLHGHTADESSELVTALRQCDGVHVQCLLMVRDDFWVAVSRFMKLLEVKVVEGLNSAMVDLFDKRHAKKVLTWLGQAFESLPSNPAEITPDAVAFLDLAIDELAEQEKVKCVRLTLFAEMLKDKPWHSATLKALGGVSGVGVRFLSQTFDSPTAPHEHRNHRDAVCNMLGALLPQSGTDIRQQARTEDDLLTASGLRERPELFADVKRILDQETRLLTPIDVDEASDCGDGPIRETRPKMYQLTHDYLVPSLREWLTLRQRTTWRGRAQLRLADRTAWWHAKPERKRLPGLLEYLWIVCLTRQHNWTDAQRKMMLRARRHATIRASIGVLAGAGIAILAIGTRAHFERKQAVATAESVLIAELPRVPDVVRELDQHRGIVEPFFRRALQNGRDGERLRASLALLPDDPGQIEFLCDRLLSADIDELLFLRDSLSEHLQARVASFASVLENTTNESDRRLRAACVLAKFTHPTDQRQRDDWAARLDFIAAKQIDAMSRDPVHGESWITAFREIGGELVRPLNQIYRDPQQPDVTRYWSAMLLSRYSADSPDVLLGLLQDADDRQFPIIFDAWVRSHGTAAQIEQQLAAVNAETNEQANAPRIARLAIALVKLGQPERAWPLLDSSPDPSVASHMIHLFARLDVDIRMIAERIVKEENDHVRRALILALGEYGAVARGSVSSVVGFLAEAHANHLDSGIHGASEWLLHNWGHTDVVAANNTRLRTGKVEGQRRWFITRKGHTMAILGPDEFLMGAPPEEQYGMLREDRHRRRISRRFGISTKEVTVEQFQRFRELRFRRENAPSDNCPQTQVTWYLAAEYCNWLSEQEGIPEDQWCYQPNETGKYATGMKAAPGFLERNGFRLPTEAEWENACRGGSSAGRYYGVSDELLAKYGWFEANSQNHTWPVGQLKPNQFGLFDTLGNVWEWVHNRMHKYPDSDQTAEDVVDEPPVADDTDRISRGGTFATPARYLRSALRNPDIPTKSNANFGFRVARTVTP